MPRTERLLAAVFAVSAGLALAACGPSHPANNDGDAGNTTVACESANDCPAGQECEGGLCVQPTSCASQADCPSGTTCDLLRGICASDDTTGGDVDGGDGGDHGGGVDGGSGGGSCHDKYDCAAGQVCKNGACAAPPASNACNADADCPRGEICNFSKQCEAGCTSQKDCDSPMLCHPQKFVCDYCSLSNPCPPAADGSPQSCVGQACVAAQHCTSTADCAAQSDGTVCKADGTCGNCTSHSDCDVDPYKSSTGSRICGLDGLCKNAVSTCTDQACQQQLGSLAYCDTTQTPPNCGVYGCLADTDCDTANGETCDTASHTCTSTPAGCDLNACNTSCSQQVDPLSGMPETCNTATCTCNGSGGGPGGGGTCTTDADCPTGQACGLGLCTDQAVDPTTGGACDATTCALGGLLGTPCVSASDPTHQCDPTMCAFSLLLGSSSGSAPCL